MTDRHDPTPARRPELFDERLSRASLLKGAAALGIGMSPLLAAACGGGSSSSSPASTASGAPRKGGTLRLGFVGGGTAETVNPYIGVTPIDEGRIQNLYDPLVIVNPDLSTSPGLALEWNPNADATVWEVKLRDGVTFHNGKTFGADDVIYSIQLMSKPANFGSYPFVAGIDVANMKALSKNLVRIPLKTPDADLSANFTYYNTWIVQNGETDFKNPVGTGPFEFVSFTPGQQSVFKQNPNYWVTGKPYVDQLQIQSISDPTARLNALLSGQIDGMAQLPFQEAKAHQASGDINVLVATSPQAMMFYMDTQKPPFNDNRVRQAFRLIADRPALIEGAISRLRHRRQRHRRQGAAVLRLDAAPARAGHREGQEPAQVRRPLEPHGRAADLGHLPRLRRVGHAARPAGDGGRRHDQSEDRAGQLVLQPEPALSEDGLRRDAVADAVAEVLLPAVAVLERAVQRDALQVGVVRERAARRRSASSTTPRRRTTGTRCSRSSTTRAATCSG